MRTNVVDHSSDKLDIAGPAIAEFYGDVPSAANTLLGMAALALPEFLIVVEVTAIVDAWALGDACELRGGGENLGR